VAQMRRTPLPRRLRMRVTSSSRSARGQKPLPQLLLRPRLVVRPCGTEVVLVEARLEHPSRRRELRPPAGVRVLDLVR